MPHRAVRQAATRHTSAMREGHPRELLGRGRAADVYAQGDGLVLRRYRTERDCGPEAAIMEHVGRAGFPVPRVIRAEGRDLVMQRVDGPTMLADVGRRPWRLWSHARTLAELHQRLAAVPAPLTPTDGRPTRSGAAIVHGDLHPDNVILGGTGPVVIDWSNARTGHPLDDVAHTWLLLATAPVPGGRLDRLLGQLGRRLFLLAFLAAVDREGAAAHLPAAADRRCADPNVADAERRAVRRFARRHAAGTPGPAAG